MKHDSTVGLHRSLDALQPWASASPSVNAVEHWLASNGATWPSILLTNSATSWGEGVATTKEHTCAEAPEQHVRSVAHKQPAAAEQRTAVDASKQPTAFDQHGERHAMPGPADEHCLAETAAQHASAEAFMQQSSVQALVQQFEHMTVASANSSKPGLAGAGLLASALDQASQRGLSANKMHLMFERAAALTSLGNAKRSSTVEEARPSRQVQPSLSSADADHSNTAASAGPSRQVKPSFHGANAKHSNTAEGAMPSRQPSVSDVIPHGTRWTDCSSSHQPSEWHLNTAFESDSWPSELRAADESRLRYADQTGCDAATAPSTATLPWTGGFAGLADAGRVAVQEYGWPPSRYACTVQH